MLPQRALVRSAQRFSQRTPARLPKRHSSTQHSFTGAEDNAFNRERAAVKQHAAESSGTHKSICRIQLEPLPPKTILTGRRSLAKALPLVRTRKPPNPRPIFSRDLPLELHTLK